MPEFQVRVLDPAGTCRQLRVAAAAESDVARVLGVPVSRLLEVAALSAPAPGTTTARAWMRRGPPLDARLVAQELAVLLDAGVPLLEALETLGEKDGGAGALALQRVADALRRGEPLSQALGQADGAFDELFVALVAASERSGRVAAVLRHHAAFLAWSEALRARLVSASIYPLMLLLAGGAVTLFLLLFVLPRFAGVFDGMESSLPPLSRTLLAFGVWAAAHPWAALLLALVPPLAALGAWRTPRGPAAVLAFAWRLPGLGRRLRTVALARLYRCVGLLAGAGVPVPEALRLASDVLAAPLRPALAEATRAVRAGRRLSAALHEQGLATPVALRMLRVGEGSGTLPSMLEQAAAFHDEEIARLADWVTRVVNPLLMLVMGAVIGTIVVLMYLPIFTLMEQVQ